jgi:hypothetical protein
VFKAHRILHHSTLGLRVIETQKKKERTVGQNWAESPFVGVGNNTSVGFNYKTQE